MCIHRMKIAHRDLKSANCLVNKHWTVKICDFGLSRILTDAPARGSPSAGTPEWMAPELFRNEPFTEKCDIFSLGVIMWELCTLSRPWEGVPPERVCWHVIHYCPLYLWQSHREINWLVPLWLPGSLCCWHWGIPPRDSWRPAWQAYIRFEQLTSNWHIHETL